MDVSLKNHMTAYHPCVLPAFKGRYYGDQCFPEGTRGFLVLRRAKSWCSARCRRTSLPGDSRKHACIFCSGPRSSGLPWCISLMAIVENSNVRKGRHYEAIRRLLLDDGFVTPALLEKCAAMRNCRRLPMCRSRIIHSFGQLFYIKFNAFTFDFYTLSMDRLQHHNYRAHYYNNRFSGQYAMVT